MSTPLRINRYLQRYWGISRRAADELVEKGGVTVDGAPASHGMIIHKNQRVLVNGKEIKLIERPFSFIVMNKPVGYICSRKGHRTVFELLPGKYKHLSYIGRLDVNTSGALLFTDYGELTNKILRADVSRIYFAELDNPLDSDALALLRKGPSIDGITAKTGRVLQNGKVIEIELFEGRWHEVRRLFDAIGYKIRKLHRKSFAGISADNIRTGKIRLLSRGEIMKLAKFAGLDKK